MQLIGPKNHVTFKRKRSSPKFHRFIRPKSSCSHATSMGLFHFSMSFGWAPLKSMGPGVIVFPYPLPLGSPASVVMRALHSGVQIFVEHWGGVNLQFYPNFVLFSTLGWMNLDHHFFQVSKLSEEQKKRCSPKIKHFFPRIQEKTKKRSSPKMEPGA